VADDEIVGMASATPGLPLRLQRSSLPPRISKPYEAVLDRLDPPRQGRTLILPGHIGFDERQEVSGVQAAGPNVAACSFVSDPEILRGAYAYLREACRSHDPKAEPWTVEPFADDPESSVGQAQLLVHGAIAAADFTRIGMGYYDDYESGINTVKPAGLYVSEIYVPATSL
jgi:hypothetical protein